MLNIAHRGFKGEFPENTMLAFKKAFEIGADGVEFDVHLTKDKELVIIHDEKLDRTTDMEGFVKDFTLKELKTANASKFFPAYEEKIPTLEEYFDFIKDKDFLTNIEIKNSIIDYPEIEEIIYEMIKAYGLKDKIIISSFNHESLVRVKNIDKNISCGVLESSRLYRPWDYVKNLGCEYFHPLNFSVDEELIEKFKENNIGINIWFGISDYDFGQYVKDGITGLITDFPNRVGQILMKKNK